jgi:hypothetical protein
VVRGESCYRCLCGGSKNNNNDNIDVVRRRAIVSMMRPPPHSCIHPGGNHGVEAANITILDDPDNGHDGRASW